MAMPLGLPLTPADSARVVGDVYGASLLATLPVLLGALAVFALRRAAAGTRVLVWRSVIVALLVTWLGPWFPVHWVAWVVPEGLASPLVALGRAQLSVLDVVPGPSRGGAAVAGSAVTGILVAYWLVVGLVVGGMLVARWRLRAVLRRATPLQSVAWRRRLKAACRRAGVHGEVRLVQSTEVRVPLTWGIVQPVVMLPADARTWDAAHLDAALVHELAHVRQRDVPWAMVARAVTALFWFHPAAWWISSRLAADVELACDDRVLLGGVRRSDYAELLAAVHGRLAPGQALAGLVRAGAWCALVTPAGGRGRTRLVRQGRLRERLRAILDPSRLPSVPTRGARAAVVLFTAVVAGPMGTVRIAPTRDVLATLMQDARWESRAWAVVRLAQRQDSLDVARAAARRDPDPQVRAWAQYALARAPGRPPFTAPSRD